MNIRLAKQSDLQTLNQILVQAVNELRVWVLVSGVNY